VWTLVVLEPDAALVPAIRLDRGAEILGPVRIRNFSSTHGMTLQPIVIDFSPYWCNPPAKRYTRGRINPVMSLERPQLGLPVTSV
jgi:hypothetical protein